MLCIFLRFNQIFLGIFRLFRRPNDDYCISSFRFHRSPPIGRRKASKGSERSADLRSRKPKLGSGRAVRTIFCTKKDFYSIPTPEFSILENVLLGIVVFGGTEHLQVNFSELSGQLGPRSI